MTAPDAGFMWVDSGWWRTPDGRRRLLSWNAATRELKLWGLDRNQPDILLAVIGTEDELHRRLDGWAEYNDTDEGLAWLARRLEGCQ